MANTQINYCGTCAHKKIEHKFQDKQYGKFNRVFNINEKLETKTCTVCGTTTKLKK